MKFLKPILIAACTMILLLTAASVSQAHPAAARAEATGLSTPELIDRAFENGEITEEQRLLYLAYALYEYDSLPPAYQSNVPWSGTQAVAEIHAAYRSLDTGWSKIQSPQMQDELERVLTVEAATVCEENDGPTTINSDHFFFNYTSVTGLTPNAYLTSLETTYATLITSYGWAQPPSCTAGVGGCAATNPGGRYPVQAADLGGGLYGYVTSGGGIYTGSVGNNPNTPATETSATASCMVLNSDYSDFPGGAQFALDATTGHEFSHSVQMGVFNGSPSPDDMWWESTAAYVEDEVFDAVNDNYYYLWPNFDNCLGQYQGNVYSNWLFFRYAAEHNGGTNVAGGGEDLFMDLFANVAAGQPSLTAYNNALAAKGTNLADVFHNYAIAARFMKSCPTGGVHCFEEAAGYLQAAGAINNQGSIASAGGSFESNLRNHYAIHWIGLPTSGTYPVTFQNTAAGGQFRVSIVADTGSALSVTPLPAVVGGNSQQSIAAYTPPVGAQRVVAVITNQQQTSGDPGTCSLNAYRLTLTGGQVVETTNTYLPLMLRTLAATGRVTFNGAPAAGMTLELRYYDGGSFSTFATGTTDANGAYSIKNLPELTDSTDFYVRWRNDQHGENPNWLWSWSCDTVTDPMSDAALRCDFDIADVKAISPVPDASSRLPVTFTWQRRYLTADSYEFNLYDPGDENPWWWTDPPIGYVDQYHLQALPSGFVYGTYYAWDVWVYGPDGSGVPFYYQTIRFQTPLAAEFDAPPITLSNEARDALIEQRRAGKSH